MLPFKKEYAVTAGYEWHKNNEKGYAVDYATPFKAELLAVVDGEVTVHDTWWGGSDTIILRGKNGVNYLYAHCYKTMKRGNVKAGDVIALAGYDGNVMPKGIAGTHLHFSASKSFQSLLSWSVNLTDTKEIDDVFDWKNIHKVVVKDTPLKDGSTLRAGTVVTYVRHGIIYVKLTVNGQTKYVHKNYWHSGRFK